MSRYGRLGITALACAALIGAMETPAGARSLRPLTTGFYDPVYEDADPATRAAWFDRTIRAGAGIVRVGLDWKGVAPARPPPGFSPADPGDPAYDWTGLDRAVIDATARGLRVLLTINRAPRWAEGPGAGARGGRGTWRPDPEAVASFARAAAMRYSGSFAAGADSPPLPRVSHWQIWNEPNLSTYLTPQGARTKRGYTLSSPSHYRKMLNAAYRALKGVSRANFVVAAGTAPYGDLTGERTAPVLFLRELLCLRGRGLRHLRCPDPARFDALSHHPFSVGSPTRRALAPNDVAIADLRKLTRVLRVARRSGRALPRGDKRFWVTEVSWDSRPPDPDGVPARRHAAWLAEAFFKLWRDGVDTIVWLLVRDSASGGDFGSTYQSGIYFRNGRPKLSQRAFRFPFVARRSGRDRLVVWGKAPIRGRVRIERRTKGGWQGVGNTSTSSSGVFLGRLRLGSGVVLRARIGPNTSLAWRVR